MIDFKLIISKSELNKYMKKISNIRKSAIPQAARSTINDLAFYARGQMQAEIEKKFILRSKFVKNRVLVNKARQRNLEDIQAETGHVMPFMKRQAEGGVITARRKKHPIPTKKARIGGNIGKSIRSIYKIYKLGNLKGNNQITIISPPGKKPGIYRRIRDQLVMIYDLSKRSVIIKKNDWITTATNKARNQHLINNLYIKNARRILRKK